MTAAPMAMAAMAPLAKRKEKKALLMAVSVMTASRLAGLLLCTHESSPVRVPTGSA